MKSKLTPEQSDRLIELGVDPSKASEKTKVYEPIDVNHRWESKVPIFDLSDVLSLLPPEIDTHPCRGTLGMVYHCGQWRVGYSNYKVFCDYTKVAPELIDALYELLCWTLTRDKK